MLQFYHSWNRFFGRRAPFLGKNKAFSAPRCVWRCVWYGKINVIQSKSNSFPCQPSLAQPSQPSQPSLSRHPASPAQPTQPAQPSQPSQPPSSLPSAVHLTGGSGFLRCFLRFLLGFPVGSGLAIKKVPPVAGALFLGKNKAFSVPRCVWCGKTKVSA